MEATTRGRYTLRAALALARIGNNGTPASIETLAEEEKIPSVILEQLFFKLRKAGIVASVRGPEGGIYFARPPDRLTVKELLDAAGENLDLTSHDEPQGEVPWGERLSRGVWAGLTDLIKGRLGGITLAALLAQEDLTEN
jgi:Rrf2 family iron-sulfur cluster assembly transcriptional regulator